MVSDSSPPSAHPRSCAEFGPPGSDTSGCRHATSSSAPMRRRSASWSTRARRPQVEIAVGRAAVPRRRHRSEPARRPARAPTRSATCPRSRSPDQVPEPFGRELLAALTDLPQVERAWLLRAGTAWTAGIQLVPDALLGDFDAVRNRLHAVATEHLGSRKAPRGHRPARAGAARHVRRDRRTVLRPAPAPRRRASSAASSASDQPLAGRARACRRPSAAAAGRGPWRPLQRQRSTPQCRRPRAPAARRRAGRRASPRQRW